MEDIGVSDSDISNFIPDYAEMDTQIKMFLYHVESPTDLQNFSTEFLNGLVFLQFLSSSHIFSTEFLKDILTSKDKLNDIDFFRKYLIPVLKKINGSPLSPGYMNEVDMIPYLNHELFPFIDAIDESKISAILKPETTHSKSPNVWMYCYYKFSQYDWRLDEFLNGLEGFITPSIFAICHESRLDTKHQTGTYYTDGLITDYISVSSLSSLIYSKLGQEKDKPLVKEISSRGLFNPEDFQYDNPDMVAFRALLWNLKVCDNACGAGNFIIAFLNLYIPIMLNRNMNFRLIYGDNENATNSQKLELLAQTISNLVTNSIYGIDIDPKAISIAKMRIWLCCVSKFNVHIRNHSEFYNIDQNRHIPFKSTLFMNLGSNLFVGDSVIGYSDQLYIPKKKNELILELYALKQQYKTEREPERTKIIFKLIKDKIKELRIDFDNNYYDEFISIQREERSDQDRIKISKEMAESRVFHWFLEIPELFLSIKTDGRLKIKPEPSKGFDIIIGNPPYVRQEKLDREIANVRVKDILKKYYSHFLKEDALMDSENPTKKCKIQSDSKKERFNTNISITTDLSSYFIIRSLELLSDNGIHSYIITSKWLKTAYGAPIRDYILRRAQIAEFIDITGLPVFGSATVDVIIYMLEKRKRSCSKPLREIRAASEFDVDYNLYALCSFVSEIHDYKLILEKFVHNSVYIEQSTLGSSNWSFISKELVEIKEWMEAQGPRLKDIEGVEINSGIKTGFNDAFVTPYEESLKIDIRHRADFKLVVLPVLRGREINQFHVKNEGNHLIYFPQGFTNKWIEQNINPDSDIQSSTQQTNNNGNGLSNNEKINKFILNFRPIFRYLMKFAPEDSELSILTEPKKLSLTETTEEAKLTSFINLPIQKKTTAKSKATTNIKATTNTKATINTKTTTIGKQQSNNKAIGTVQGPNVKKGTSKRKKKGLIDRDDQGEYWWELRPCEYYRRFFEPKIIWQEISNGPQFHWDTNSFFLLNTAYMMNGAKKAWVAILNSKIIHYYFSLLSAKLGNSGDRFTKQYVEQIPIVPLNKTEERVLEWFVDNINLNYITFKNNMAEFLLFLSNQVVFELYFYKILYQKGFYKTDQKILVNEVDKLIKRIQEDPSLNKNTESLREVIMNTEGLDQTLKKIRDYQFSIKFIN